MGCSRPEETVVSAHSCDGRCSPRRRAGIRPGGEHADRLPACPPEPVASTPTLPMPDYAGPLQHLVLSRTLWLILLWPLLGAAWQIVVERRRQAGGAPQDAFVARGTAIGSLALTATAALAH